MEVIAAPESNLKKRLTGDNVRGSTIDDFLPAPTRSKNLPADEVWLEGPRVKAAPLPSSSHVTKTQDSFPPLARGGNDETDVFIGEVLGAFENGERTTAWNYRLGDMQETWGQFYSQQHHICTLPKQTISIVVRFSRQQHRKFLDPNMNTIKQNFEASGNGLGGY